MEMRKICYMMSFYEQIVLKTEHALKNIPFSHKRATKKVRDKGENEMILEKQERKVKAFDSEFVNTIASWWVTSSLSYIYI